MPAGFIETVLSTTQMDQLAEAGLFAKLSGYVNEMLIHHFNELINLLYRIDVDEAKLKKLLRENKDKDAGDIIAALIIERQAQKIQSRKKFSVEKKDKQGEDDW